MLFDWTLFNNHVKYFYGSNIKPINLKSLASILVFSNLLIILCKDKYLKTTGQMLLIYFLNYPKTSLCISNVNTNPRPCKLWSIFKVYGEKNLGSTWDSSSISWLPMDAGCFLFTLCSCYLALSCVSWNNILKIRILYSSIL